MASQREIWRAAPFRAARLVWLLEALAEDEPGFGIPPVFGDWESCQGWDGRYNRGRRGGPPIFRDE